MARENLMDVLDTKALAKQLGISEAAVMKQLNSMTELEKEQWDYTKTDLSEYKTVTKSEGKRIDNLKDGEKIEISDGTLERKGDMIHVESKWLGTFDYNPDEFCYGYKELTEKDGSKSQLPVLEYVGGEDGEKGPDWLETRWSNIKIPDGIKSCDYMFEGNKDLRCLPRIPDSVTSAHYMYANCSGIICSTEAGYDGENMINVNGSYHLPDGLRDMSGMFKNCPAMYTDFGKLPKNVVNITECWKGDEQLNWTESRLLGLLKHTYTLPDVGEELTPYLSAAFAKDAFAGISTESVKEFADELNYVIGKDGAIDPTYQGYVNEAVASGELDKELLDEAQAAAGVEFQEDVLDGKVDTENEIASNGARTDNIVYNAATGEYENDVTGELQSDSKNNPNELWQRLAIDGLTGLGLGWAAKKLTGSGTAGLIAGVGGAVLLDKVGILPKSFSPLLQTTAKLLPEGSDAQKKLLEWSNQLSGSTLDEQKANLRPEDVAGRHQEVRLQSSVQAANSVLVQDVTKSMQNNGKEAAMQMAFWSTATKGEASAQVVNKYVVSKCTSAMEAQWSADIKNGKPTSEQKEEMKSYYDKMFGALDAYNKGAMEGMNEKFGNGSVRAELSTYGLHMTNRAYMAGVMDSMLRMNEKYKLFTPEDIKAMQDKYDIQGVGDLSKYKDVSSFADIMSEEELEVDSLVSVDSMEDNTEDKDSVSDEASDVSGQTQSVQQAEVPQSEVAKTEVSSEKSNKENGSDKAAKRRAEVNAQFGDMEKAYDQSHASIADKECGGGGRSF